MSAPCEAGGQAGRRGGRVPALSRRTLPTVTVPELPSAPPEFQRAVASLHAARPRPEVRVRETGAPQRLAPFAVALAADVDGDPAADGVLASGRLVVLHDPSGQEGWGGRTRLVAYGSADLDAEIVADPVLPAVGWAWLTEAWQGRGATATAEAGTVTRVTSEHFGGLAERAPAASLEVRASWTPLGDDLGPHLLAWTDLLAALAGLPPLTPGVTALPSVPR